MYAIILSEAQYYGCKFSGIAVLNGNDTWQGGNKKLKMFVERRGDCKHGVFDMEIRGRSSICFEYLFNKNNPPF